ncbi:MAG: phosphatidylglycerophosphatase PgpB [Acidimicrobiia bacterium]|nr:MAG: phosphatidylglycerophosphatase PgpB [Acidimicrobiia bacterium]
MDVEEQQTSGFTLAAWLFGSFGFLTVLVVAGWTQPLDETWNVAMANAEMPWLVDVAEGFNWIGSVPIAFSTAAIVSVFFLVMRRWWIAGAWIVMVGGAQILSSITKVLVGRDRPMDALVHESSAAYPSGHAMVAGAAMAIGLAVLLGFLWPNRYRLFVSVGVAYALLMAWSRAYLRVHWLSDVVGGLLLGTAVVVVVASAFAIGRSSASRSGDDPST